MMQHPTTSLLNILNETPINDIDEFVAEYGVEFNTGEFFSNYMYRSEEPRLNSSHSSQSRMPSSA